MGHSVPKCDKCMPNFWAYTSFGCRGEDHLKDLSVILFVKIGLWREVGSVYDIKSATPNSCFVLFFEVEFSTYSNKSAAQMLHEEILS